MNESNLKETALSLGATRAELIGTDQVVFSEELRQMCEMNTCRKYNTTWTCPPAVGEVRELKEKILGFDQGLVLQKVYQLEDCFDVEGMEEGKDQFLQMFHRVWDHMQTLGFSSLLPLTAGGCNLCETCAYPDAPCRHPDQAFPSIEACGIYVNKTIEQVSIPYNNGEATVSYVGIIFFSL